ncbi:MAG: threonine ammonia-lyase [Oligoflexia bacterium]|nr:threonine ammonia-lyase [Oligoflexia bacterium]
MKVSIKDIQEAEKKIREHIVTTPLDLSRSATTHLGESVYLKFENLQLTGSFKIRGAASKLSSLSSQEAQRGVIAASAGNHAQGVACMAHKLGIKATIVMPEASPLIKVLSTQRFGPEIILKGSNYDEAYAHALELQKSRGLVFVHPFEDEKVIAGQGTCGLEIQNQLPDVDVVYCAVGGGGWISGVATALKAFNPKIKIIGVQAAGAKSMHDSFKSKKIVTLEKPVSTIADGIAVKRPSAVMYEQFISRLVDDMVTVSEDEIAHAIVFLMERAKTVVEGAGAASFAALMNKRSIIGKKNLALLSGGNIDLNIIERVIDRGLQASGRLSRITVAAPDIPGTLNRLTTLIAERKANILQINHNRVSDRIALRETMIEFILESSGLEQIRLIKEDFERAGVKILD